MTGSWVLCWGELVAFPSAWVCFDRDLGSRIEGISRCTVFGKHCECIAQKCTHLERLPPLASHLVLPSHCVLTWHGRKKLDIRNLCDISGFRTPNTFDQDSCIHRLGQSNGCKQWVVPCPYVNADLSKHQNFTTFCWRPKNSVNAENNESFIYILFKLYMQV